MMRLERPLDLAQPFATDIHPLGCTCSHCEAEHTWLGAMASICTCAVIAFGAFILGQLVGWALNAAGILAAIGIA